MGMVNAELEDQWGSEERHGDWLLTRWATWSRRGEDGPKKYKALLALLCRSPGGAQTIHDDLALQIDKAVCECDEGARAIIRRAYLCGDFDGFSDSTLIRCVREFLDAFHRK